MPSRTRKFSASQNNNLLIAQLLMTVAMVVLWMLPSTMSRPTNLNSKLTINTLLMTVPANTRPPRVRSNSQDTKMLPPTVHPNFKLLLPTDPSQLPSKLTPMSSNLTTTVSSQVLVAEPTLTMVSSLLVMENKTASNIGFLRTLGDLTGVRMVSSELPETPNQEQVSAVSNQNHHSPSSEHRLVIFIKTNIFIDLTFTHTQYLLLLILSF